MVSDNSVVSSIFKQAQSYIRALIQSVQLVLKLRQLVWILGKHVKAVVESGACRLVARNHESVEIGDDLWICHLSLKMNLVQLFERLAVVVLVALLGENLQQDVQVVFPRLL